MAMPHKYKIWSSKIRLKLPASSWLLLCDKERGILSSCMHDKCTALIIYNTNSSDIITIINKNSYS